MHLNTGSTTEKLQVVFIQVDILSLHAIYHEFSRLLKKKLKKKKISTSMIVMDALSPLAKL